jgi:hypothetical protein
MMRTTTLSLILAVAFCVVGVVSSAQAQRGMKPKIESRQLPLPDLSVKQIYFEWKEVTPKQYSLFINPLLAKNKNDKIVGSKPPSAIVTVSAINAKGEHLKDCDIEIIAWVSQDAELLLYNKCSVAPEVAKTVKSIKVFADSKKQIKEANENNNLAYAPVPPNEKPEK